MGKISQSQALVIIPRNPFPIRPGLMGECALVGDSCAPPPLAPIPYSPLPPFMPLSPILRPILGVLRGDGLSGSGLGGCVACRAFYGACRASPAGSGRNCQGGHWFRHQGAQGGALRAWTPASRPDPADFPVADRWGAAAASPVRLIPSSATPAPRLWFPAEISRPRNLQAGGAERLLGGGPRTGGCGF